jgi:hypothetical protein
MSALRATLQRRFIVASNILSSRVKSLGRDRTGLALVIFLGLLPILWLTPYTAFLFGTDSYHLFNPFGYNFSPLAQYGYLYAPDFPVPDSAPLLYIGSASTALFDLSIPYQAVERSLIVAGCLIGCYGVYRIIRVIDEINGRLPNSHLTATGLAIAFYLVNPYALSIIWWHFEGWTPAYFYTPILIAFLLRISYMRSWSSIELLFVAILSIVMAPGLAGTYVVPFVFLLSAFSCVLAFHSFDGTFSRREALWRAGVLWALGVAAIGWDLVPYLLIPGRSLIVTNSITSSNILPNFIYQSRTTDLLNVTRLTAFNWIYNTPSAYAWTSWLPEIQIAGFGILFIFALACLRIRTTKGLAVLVVISLISVLISTGDNPPFGPINEGLLSLGGPFLIITNAYYFVGQLYVTTLALCVYLVASDTVGALLGFLTWRQVGIANPEPPASVNARQAVLPAPQSNRLHSRPPKPIVSATILTATILMLCIFAVPFAQGKVYQTQGENIDAFQVPSSYFDLQTFFERNYSGPFYNVLQLPLSTLPASQLVSISNQSFDDSTYLLASFVPYPLIWTNNSGQVAALDNLLAEREYQSLVPVFQALHIRYIIVSPFYASGPVMSYAPDGSPLNLIDLVGELTEELGPPTSVGSFQVFLCPEATPIVTASSSLSTLVTSTFPSYLGFLSSMSVRGSESSPTLANLPWSESPVPGLDSSAIVRTAGLPQTVGLGDARSLVMIAGNGSTAQLTIGRSQAIPGLNASLNASASELTLFGNTVTNLNDTANYTTDMERSDGALENPFNRSSSLVFRTSTNGQAVLHVAAAFQGLSPQDWFAVDLVDGRIEVQIQLYAIPSSDHFDFSTTALNGSRPYAWEDRPVSGSLFRGPDDLTVWVNSTQVFATVSTSSGADAASLSVNTTRRGLFIPPDWHNLTAAPMNLTSAENFVPGVNTVNAALTLTGMQVTRQSPVVYVVLNSNTTLPAQVPVALFPAQSGDVNAVVHTGRALSRVYLDLAFPQLSLWTVSTPAGVHASKLSGMPNNNAFVLSAAQTSLPGNLTITLTFNTSIDEGIYVSVGEVVVFSGAAVWMVIRRRAGRG